MAIRHSKDRNGGTRAAVNCGSESCPRKAKKPSRKTRQSRRWPMVWRSRDERRTTLRRTRDLHIPLRDELCRVRQGHDRLEPLKLVRQDVRWWWPIAATTVDLPRRCLSAPCRTEIYLCLEAFACVYECMCACSRMQSSSIEHVQERHR